MTQAPVANSVRLAGLPVRLALFGASLVLTGAAGLIYQVVWFRALGLIFGVTVQATSAVLAAFMGGLALGSLVAWWLTRRIRRPMRAYGIAEIVIGIFGLASLPIFDSLQPLYRSLAGALGDAEGPVVGLRFVIALLVMLAPTTLMGATLPLALMSFGSSDTTGRNVGILYAANTTGAIAGAFAAGYFIIGAFGLDAAVRIAAAMNIAVGLVWALSDRAQGAALPAAPAASAAKPAPLSGQAKAVLAAAALSGFASLGLEVVWTRLLIGIFPGTVYAFATMLCAILAGIALGSALISPLLRLGWGWARVYAASQAAMALAAAYSFWVIGQGYAIEAWLRRALGSRELLLGEPWFMAGLTLLALLPCSLLMGISFPISARLFAAGGASVASRTGLLYAANTAGAIAGSLAPAFVLLPLLGAQRGGWVLAGAAIAGALLVLVAGRNSPVAWVPTGALASAAIALAVLSPPVYQALGATDPRGERLVWQGEGRDATIKVTRSPGQFLTLYVNSEGQATDVGSELAFHYRLGHLGPLLHPSPTDTLVVGLGGGPTAGAAALHETSVTIVELYPGVVEAAKLFDHVTWGVLDRPNVQTLVNDGRNHMLLSGKSYDLILADIILPRNAGAGNLYSVDYYKLARQTLKPGGLMVQWVDASLPEYAYKLMLRSFIEAFPDSTLWYDGSVIVGSAEPFAVDPESIADKFARATPELRTALGQVGLASANDVQREFVASAEEIRAFASAGPLITDRHPRLEYFRTLPEGGSIADLRWRRLAEFVGARERTGDGIIFGHESLQPLFETYHANDWPSMVSAGTDAAAISKARSFLEARGRVWFLPQWQSESDVALENALTRTAYKAVNRQIGNQRILLFVAAQGEPPRARTGASFGGLFRLDTAGVEAGAFAPGDLVRIGLDWEALDDFDEEVRRVVRLRDAAGRVVATVDGLPGDAPTAVLRERARVLDRFAIALPPGLAPGRLRVEVDAYVAATGAPLRVAGANAPGNRVVVGEVAVGPQSRPLAAAAVEAPRTTTFNAGPARLAGVAAGATRARPGDPIPYVLYWRADSAGAFPAGEVRLQRDGVIAARFPLTATPVGPEGTFRADTIQVRPPTSALAGRYDVALVTASGPTLMLGHVTVEASQPPPTPAAPAVAVDLRLRNGATLVGMTITRGSTLRADAVWRAEQDIPSNFVVFVQLLGPDGSILAQSDSPPVRGAWPTTSWRTGQLVGDSIELRTGTIPAGSRLIVGMYDPDSLQRASAADGRDSAIFPLD